MFAEKNCPTCGQPLPPGAQVEAMRRFEEAKERAKADAIERADAAKDVRASAVDRRDKDYASAAYAASEVHRLTAELAAYVPEEQPEISDLPDYAARVTTLDGKISLLDADVRQLMGETSTIRAAGGIQHQGAPGEGKRFGKRPGEGIPAGPYQGTLQRADGQCQDTG